GVSLRGRRNDDHPPSAEPPAGRGGRGTGAADRRRGAPHRGGAAGADRHCRGDRRRRASARGTRGIRLGHPDACRAEPRGRAPGRAPSGAPIVTLTPEAMERAHIRVEPIAIRPLAAQLIVPGTIEANGYKEVVVKALAAGRLTRVAVELGTPVRRGTILAELY